jgi:PAS domain S-box-containing protein
MSQGRWRVGPWWLGAVLLPVVSAVLVVVAAAALLAATDRSERRQSEAAMRGTAALASAYVHEQTTGLADVVASYSLRQLLVQALAQGRTDEIMAILRALHGAREGLAFALVTDPAGRLVGAYPAGAGRIGADSSRSDWYRGAVATGRPYVSDVHRAAGAPGSPYVVAGSALVRAPSAGGRPGRVLGVVAAGYLVDSFQRFVDGYQRGQGIRLRILDQHGMLVAAAGQAAGATAGQPPGRQRGAVAATARDPVTGWTVVSELPAGQASAAAAQERRVVLAAAVLVVLLLLTGAALRTRSAHSRRAAEQALRASEERFRLLAENSTDMITRTTPYGTALYVSPASVRMLGYPPDEVIGTSLLALVHPDDLAAVADAQQELPGPDQSRTITVRVRHRDGHWVWLESVYRSTKFGEDGRPVEMSASSRDVTGRKRDEVRLRVQRQQTRSIISTASDPFIAIDPHGVVTDWNHRAEVVFGWPRDEAMGRELAELIIPPHLRQAHRDGLRRVLSGGERRVLDRRVELTALHRDGHEVAVELAVWQMGSGSERSFNAFVRDISERRETERALAEARDQALAASQLKSQFVATMSHEIRTPMNGVIGLTGLLLDTPLDETQRRYAEGIRTAGDALLGIINDVLDFSKIEAGKLDLDESDFDLGLLVEEVVEMVAEPARTSGLELVGYCDPRLPTAVRGDRGRLRQVLLNLSANAVKFTKQGEVVVKAVPAESLGPAGTMTVRFEVIDTGIGIKPEVREHLFEPFSQADSSTTRDYGGTGLGLAISRRLIEAMGGQLGADSQPGRGSTFWCLVPLLRQPGVPPEPAGAELEGLRVLLVDDNQTNRVILEQQLRAWRMEPEAVESGQRAIARVREAAATGRPFELAVLDLHMPGMNGMDLAGRITADPAIPNLPQVLLTSGGYVDIEAAGAAGIVASLTKPVHQSQLRDCLLRLVTLSQAPSHPARETSMPAPVRPPTRAHVLLVEDNDINRTVALGVLAKLGYSADVAANGLEALERLSGASYAAVLMDCQMPEMDGYTATRELRLREGSARHTPIIAMTASALAEDRERCLAAGMDDYVSKPVRLDDLDATMSRWLDQPRSAPEAQRPDQEGELVQSSIERRLDQLRGPDPAEDEPFLSELIGSFLAEAPVYVGELAGAVARGDAAALGETAHTLKGAAGNLGATRLAALCEELEALGRGGRPRSAGPIIERLRAEFDLVRDAMDNVLAQLASTIR